MLASNTWLATLSLSISFAQAFPTHQFDQPLSTWHSLIRGIVQNTCRSEYATYQTGSGSGNTTRYEQTGNLINCVLGQLSEYRKATMAASAVILGSTPLVMQTVGSTTAETAILGLRRPLLATLLATGSPAVAAIKSDQFMEVLSKFVQGNHDKSELSIPVFRWTRKNASLQSAVSAFQYVLAGAAVANVATLAYQLGVHAIVAFAPTVTLLPPLWTFLAIVIHLGGTAAFHSRVKVRRKQDYDVADGVVPKFILCEFTPSALQPPRDLEWRNEHVWFYGLTWLLNLVTIIQILFGTLILSSLLFFTVRDAALVLGRYTASAIICRAILRFELAGCREANLSQKIDVENLEMAT
ncbi:hypothetical protein PWT90_10185 [Aphanocladium album]|nr:hypothetical protein PWT90_10185 [Aphanocladium album]